jgi:predicted nucleic acid-binding protein
MNGMTEEAGGPLVYLDTNIFIFFYEGTPDISGRVKLLFDALRKQPGKGTTSELTLAEVLAEPERPRLPALKRAYLDLIVWSNFLELVPISRDILYESADLRSTHRDTHSKKLDLPDAIHLTTAVQRHCRFFVSGDEGIKPPNEIVKVSPLTGNFDGILSALDGV